MALLDLVKVVGEMLQLRRRRNLQGEAELGIELPESAAQHGLDLGARGLRLVQRGAQLVEGLQVDLLHAQLEALLLQRLRQLREFRLEGLGAQLLEHVPQELEVDGAHGLDLGGAQVELALLLLDAVAHRLDHRGVLAPQAAQLGHLVVEVAVPDVDGARGFAAQAGHAVGHGRPQDRLPPAHDALGQGFLQHGQPAGFEQQVIGRDLGHQPLLCRHGDHPVQRNAQHLRGGAALALHLGLHLLCGVQGVPQGIDLVQHHQAAVHAVGRNGQVLPPDGQVGARHAGVRAQDEHHRVRLGNQVDRELGLCPHGVQPGRIQDDQALLEQGVGNVDDRVAPHGHLHQALRIRHWILVGQVVMPEPQRAGVLHADLAHFRDFFQGFGDLVRITDVQGDFLPAVGLDAPLRQALRLQPGFDGQQPKARGNAGLVSQLGGAHGGAPGTRGHDPAPIVGEEDGVDQLRFAAGELGDERHHDLVAADLLLEPVQALLHGGVHEVVRGHPVGQPLELLGELPPPDAVLVELLVE